MIVLKDVTKILGEKIVLSNISLEFYKGKFYFLKGHNGSGKTMLLRLICGLIKPTSGKIDYNNNYTYGVIIENPAFLENETAFYNLKFLAKINNKIGDDVIIRYLELFDLLQEKDKKVKTFSLGMKQRLALIQALMEDPDVLLLDEPFNALDEQNMKATMKELKEEKLNGKTIIVASHYIDDNIIELSDEIIHLNDGKIFKVEKLS